MLKNLIKNPKRYQWKGANIDVAMFDLEFEPTKNFAAYRQSELDNARVPTFTQMSANIMSSIDLR